MYQVSTVFYISNIVIGPPSPGTPVCFLCADTKRKLRCVKCRSRIDYDSVFVYRYRMELDIVCVFFIHIEPFFLPVDIQHNQCPCRLFNPTEIVQAL